MQRPTIGVRSGTKQSRRIKVQDQIMTSTANAASGSVFLAMVRNFRFPYYRPDRRCVAMGVTAGLCVALLLVLGHYGGSYFVGLIATLLPGAPPFSTPILVGAMLVFATCHLPGFLLTGYTFVWLFRRLRHRGTDQIGVVFFFTPFIVTLIASLQLAGLGGLY